MKAAKKGTAKPPKKAAVTKKAPAAKKARGFSDEERAAMKEYVQELKGNKANDEGAVLAKIATFPQPDRALAERLHALVKATAPGLSSRTWYGMPAYTKDGNVVCYFQNGQKFKTRYSTLGFSDKAKLDDGHMWPTAFALQELTADEEARIVALLKKAVS